MTISNMFDTFKTSAGNLIQVPFPKDAPEKWTVMAFDVQYYLEHSGIFKGTGITNFDHLHSLKQIQICS